jgi:hypothetical protein
MAAKAKTEHAPDELVPGTPVRVRSPYDDVWWSGYEISSVHHDVCLVRRPGDGVMIATRLHNVRRAKRP